MNQFVKTFKKKLYYAFVKHSCFILQMNCGHDFHELAHYDFMEHFNAVEEEDVRV